MKQICSICGSEIEEGSSKCPSCGSQIDEFKDISHMPAYASPSYEAAPPKTSSYSVLGTIGFLGNIILFSIPLIGWIFCIVWALGGCRNKNRINHARAMILLFVLLLLVFGIFAAIMYFTGNFAILTNYFQNFRL